MRSFAEAEELFVTVSRTYSNMPDLTIFAQLVYDNILRETMEME